MVYNRIGKTVLYILLILLIFSGTYPAEKISYFHSSTIDLPADTTLFFAVNFKDDVASDSLQQTLSKEGYPIRYSREIRTGVCFDNKCRPLDITLYWNITGRYLGFELPEKEFLSKYDHEPFTQAEYQRLHEILTDSLSALANFHYNEIVPKSDSVYEKVDAVSGATSASVLEHVVEGAAFTTYKLWHLVYGNTRHQVQQFTTQSLTPELVERIVNSPHPSDKIWAFNHIKGYVTTTPKLQKVVLSYIGADYNLSERALHSIDATALHSAIFQLALTDKFLQADYSLKKLILAKLKQAPELDKAVSEALRNNLSSINGEIAVNVLDLFLLHNITDLETCLVVSNLLSQENNFVSKKAYTFLSKVKHNDSTINERLAQYKVRNPGL